MLPLPVSIDASPHTIHAPDIHSMGDAPSNALAVIVADSADWRWLSGLDGYCCQGNLQSDRASRHHIIVNKQTTIVGFDSVPPWKEALSKGLHYNS